MGVVVRRQECKVLLVTQIENIQCKQNSQLPCSKAALWVDKSTCLGPHAADLYDWTGGKVLSHFSEESRIVSGARQSKCCLKC